MIALSNLKRTIIRPKPLLLYIEIAVGIIILAGLAGFYIFLAVEGLSNKAHYLSWVIIALSAHIVFTVIADTATGYLATGYELTSDSLIITKSGWLSRFKTETISFSSITNIESPRKSQTAITVKNSTFPKICYLLSNGDVLCRALTENWRLHNLNSIDEQSKANTESSLLNTPRFILINDNLTAETSADLERPGESEAIIISQPEEMDFIPVEPESDQPSFTDFAEISTSENNTDEPAPDAPRKITIITN
jgi:membrane protein YdbS with pleckstrin-like domain